MMSDRASASVSQLVSQPQRQVRLGHAAEMKDLPPPSLESILGSLPTLKPQETYNMLCHFNGIF